MKKDIYKDEFTNKEVLEYYFKHGHLDKKEIPQMDPDTAYLKIMNLNDEFPIGCTYICNTWVVDWCCNNCVC